MTCPPLPNLEDLMAFRNDPDAVRIARKLKAYILHAADLVALEALYAAAAHRFPNDAPMQALQKLGMETTALLRDLSRLGEDARSVLDAERARLEPMTRAATKRLFAAVERLGNIPRIVACHEGTAREKRRELKLLGVEDQAIIERVAPMPDRKQFEAEEDALKAEIAALERFIRTAETSPTCRPVPSRNQCGWRRCTTSSRNRGLLSWRKKSPRCWRCLPAADRTMAGRRGVNATPIPVSEIAPASQTRNAD